MGKTGWETGCGITFRNRKRHKKTFNPSSLSAKLMGRMPGSASGHSREAHHPQVKWDNHKGIILLGVKLSWLLLTH